MKKSNSGFTLIELLLSLAIFSIMAVAVYSAFASGIGVWRKAKEMSTTYQMARLVLEEVAEDLRNTVMITGSPFVGQTGYISFLVVRRGSGVAEGTPSSEIRRITYEVKRDKASSYDALYRLDESYVEGLQEGHEAPDYFAGPLTAVAIEYAGREEEGTVGSWRSSWEENDAIPAGVQITLTMPGREEDEFGFSKTVFMPQGLKEPEDGDEQ